MTSEAERARWLAQRRDAVIAEYDSLAPDYDRNAYPSDMQLEWVVRLLESLPPESLVLDAPCGTGKYFGLVAAAGHRVVGVDQSSGMLEQARARGIALELQHVPLQELAYRSRFAAVLTIDAMENVPPEDWPRVVSNLHRALRPGGALYMTVEEEEESAINQAYEKLKRQGAPAVRGEIVEGDVAGYHYYPGRQRVLEWLAADGLAVVQEDYKQEEGWGYRHFLLRPATDLST